MRLQSIIAAAIVALVLTAASATGALIITGANVKNSSLTGADVKNHSLTPRDFTGSVQGPQGPAGTSGIASITVVESAPSPYCAFGGGACAVTSATATCPAGSRATGGAARATSIETSISTIVGATTYGAVSDNVSPFTGTLTAQAICASGSGVRAASATSARAVRSAVDRTVATLRSQRAR